MKSHFACLFNVLLNRKQQNLMSPSVALAKKFVRFFPIRWLWWCLVVFNFIRNNFVRLYADGHISGHISMHLKNVIKVGEFLKYILLIMLLQLSHFFSPLYPPCLIPPFPPAFHTTPPHLSSCLSVTLISSSASSIPILF